MGFEILPIEDGDEEIFEIFTITAPVRWTPQRFLHDPSETTPFEVAEVPTATYSVHTDAPFELEQQEEPKPQEQPPTFALLEFDIVKAATPLMETQVYATSTWHR